MNFIGLWVWCSLKLACRTDLWSWQSGINTGNSVKSNQNPVDQLWVWVNTILVSGLNRQRLDHKASADIVFLCQGQGLFWNTVRRIFFFSSSDYGFPRKIHDKWCPVVLFGKLLLHFQKTSPKCYFLLVLCIFYPKAWFAHHVLI